MWSGQLFLECDREGSVHWMSEAARARLSGWNRLAPGVPQEQDAPLRAYLERCGPGDTIEVTCHTRGNRDVPVRLSCLIAAQHRIILAIEVRERAADRIGRSGGDLSSLEGRMLQHYFRLLRIQQSLDSRLERGRRSAGKALVEQLERERARLGRELHTGAGQAYSAIRYQLEWIEKKAPELPPEIRECLNRIGKAARDADAEVRAVSNWLHPPDWQALGLVEALRALWNNAGIAETLGGSLSLAALSAEPPHPVRVAVYRIAQEGLSNAIRHAGATRLALALREEDGRLHLRLEDNGRGFDPRQSAAGIGLRSMQEQTRALGGEIEIQSGPGGTTLEVRIPLEPGND